MKIKQKLHLARQRTHGASLREWLHDRQQAATKRRRAEHLAHQAQPCGVDRVPARYRDEERELEYLVQHTTPSRQMRRRNTKSKPGRPLPRLREQRAARLEYEVGEALVGRSFVTDEGEQAAIKSVRRWTR